MNPHPRIVVVGAGIGGLAAAHALLTFAADRGLAFELVLLEAASRPGGELATVAHQGALLERGPDSLVTHKPAAIALCRRLGLGDDLRFLPPGSVDILFRGRLRPVPSGFALLAPTRLAAALASPLLSWRGKLRLLCERWVRAGAPADESVAGFVRRRFGAEVAARLGAPIVGGIYMADAERLSLAATLPRFLDLERAHGSVTRGLRQVASPAAGAAGRAAPGVATLSGGLGKLVDTLVAGLPPGTLRLDTRVETVEAAGEGFVVRLADGPPVTANAVLVATPAHAAASLLSPLDPGLAAELARLDYASCATINLAWERQAVLRPPTSQGFFVPRGEAPGVVAATFVDVKFPERVPAGQVVARVFVGGALWPGIADRDDAELVALAQAAVGPLLGAPARVSWSRVFRHPRSMPQLAVGHLDWAAGVRSRLAHHPGLDLAGAPVGAFGVPGAVAAGEEGAARIAAWVTSRP